MDEKERQFRYFVLVGVVCLVACLAGPVPALAETRISSDVISAAGGPAGSSSFSIHDTFGQDPMGPVAVGGNVRLYDGFWSALAAAANDTTPPDTLVSFGVTPLDESTFLEWQVPMDSDLSGTLIMYKTSGFPSGPADGTPVENGQSGTFPVGSGQSFTHSALTNGMTYYYAAFDYDAAGNYSTAVTDSATPFDGLAPGPLVSFTAEAGDGFVTLGWTNPADADFHHSVIRYSTSAYPADPSSGLPVDGVSGEFENDPGSSEEFIHSGLSNNTTYYYSGFACDEVPNCSVVSQASATPADDSPPGDFLSAGVTALADGSLMLRWQAPEDDDVEGVLIRYAVGYPPFTRDDGLPLPNGKGGVFDTQPAERDTFYHRGLISDSTYYYSLWAFDEVPNYSARTSVYATAHDGVPPDLALSVFQNPYLTEYLDIYLIGSEALTDTSVYCAIGGEEVDMHLADEDESVWMGDYDLGGTGIMTVYAMARDVSLNWAEVTHEFSATLVLRAAGGVAGSPDGRAVIDIPPGAFERDTYVLIAKDDAQDVSLSSVYKVSPTGLDLNGFMKVSIACGEEAGPPEHLTIARLERGIVTPIASYVDRDNGRLLAFVDRLGTYGIKWNPDETTPEYGAGEFTVLQNVPNPFSGTTTISFTLPRAGRVQADVVTIDGRLVTRLCESLMIPGRHCIRWDGMDIDGRSVASGVYFYRVRFGSETVTKKMVSLH